MSKNSKASKRHYKKSIELEYQYVNTPESEQVLEEVFSKIFSHIIQEQKQLRTYLKSDELKKDYEYLCKKRSSLADYLSIHIDT